MATIPEIQPIPKLDPFKGMKVIPLDEFSHLVTAPARAASRRW